MRNGVVVPSTYHCKGLEQLLVGLDRIAFRDFGSCLSIFLLVALSSPHSPFFVGSRNSTATAAPMAKEAPQRIPVDEKEEDGHETKDGADTRSRNGSIDERRRAVGVFVWLLQ